MPETKKVREARVLNERFEALLNRQVGFELFDPAKAFLWPGKTYVAQSGYYVLIGFSERAQADRFFDLAVKDTH